MAPDSSSLEERAAALHQAYVAKLPDTVRKLEALWYAVLEGQATEDEQNRLYHDIHALSGSGATYGLGEISEVAARIETVVLRYLLHDEVPSRDDQLQVRSWFATLNFIATETHAHPKDMSVLELLPAIAATGAKGTMLVAEDSTFLRAKLVLGLEAAGYAVLEATNGVQALALARQSRPDVILMDVMMPRMDGLEATWRMRQEPALQGTPIIIITSVRDEEQVRQAVACNVDAYLEKPVHWEDLLARVEACMAATRPCRSHSAQVTFRTQRAMSPTRKS